MARSPQPCPAGPRAENRYLELKGRPKFDADGHFAGYRGIGREVTERARLAADLERSEERTVALIAYAHDGYWEQDADLRYTTLTASSGHLTDLAAEDVMGSRRWELPGVSPTSEPWASHIAHLRQIEPFSDFLFCRHDAQGRPVWLMESGIPVFDQRGSLPAIAAQRVTSRQRSHHGTNWPGMKPCSGRSSSTRPLAWEESPPMDASCRPIRHSPKCWVVPWPT
jgi:PAS domain-containing protein